MEKIKKYIETFEKVVLQWLVLNRFKIFRFVVIAALLKGFSLLPYINLAFTPSLISYLVVILAIVIFDMSYGKIIAFSFVIFGFCLIFTLMGDIELAETLANFIYFMLAWMIFKFTLADF